MTSRERVLTSLNHQEPDRLPIDVGGHRSSGIAAIAYARLRKFLGLDDRPIRVYDPAQQLAVIDSDFLDRFQIDTIELGRAFALRDEHWVDWTLPDGTPCQMPNWAIPERADREWVIRSKRGQIIARMPDGCLFFEQAHYPFGQEDDLDGIEAAFEECMWTALASPPGPIVAGPNGASLLAEGAQRLRAGTDRAVIGLFGGSLLELGQFLYRNDNFFMLLAGDPEHAHAFLDRLVEIHLRNLEQFLTTAGPFIDIILFGDDLGMQTGPQISPAMYAEFFQPRQKLMWTRAKQLAPHIQIMLHCCGGVRPLLSGLIEAGLDAINPVQTTCAGMNPVELKSDFGERLTFWGGGCDTREVLVKGTPDQVRQHVHEQLEVWAPGGGYVFQQVHNIMADVPPANVVAMLDAVREF